jgi:hypothetical protein
MKFATESKMKTWYQAIELQRKKLARPVPEPEEIPKTGFSWMGDHLAPIPNPNAEPSDDDSVEDYFATVTQPPLPQAPLPRNPVQYYQAKWPADLVGRSVRPPPAMAMNSSHTSVAQQHSRSYSNPDINAHTGDRSLQTNTMNSQIPALPGITPHQHHPSRSPILVAPPRLSLRPLIKDESDQNWL